MDKELIRKGRTRIALNVLLGGMVLTLGWWAVSLLILSALGPITFPSLKFELSIAVIPPLLLWALLLILLGWSVAGVVRGIAEINLGMRTESPALIVVDSVAGDSPEVEKPEGDSEVDSASERKPARIFPT